MTAPPTHSRRPNDSPASNQDDKAAKPISESMITMARFDAIRASPY